MRSPRARDVTVVADLAGLVDLLGRRPDAVALVDEQAIEPVSNLHALIGQRREARFVVMVPAVRPGSMAYFDDGADAVLSHADALGVIGSVVPLVQAALCPVPRPLLDLLLRHVQRSALDEESEARVSRLSSREFEILEHLASGEDAGQIATALDLSVHTVRSHLKRIFRKLDVHSMLEAVLVAVGAGVVPRLPERTS